ncbi:MAG: biotin/lipoyl-binding protein [Patescibacteria group bacterium]
MKESIQVIHRNIRAGHIPTIVISIILVALIVAGFGKAALSFAVKPENSITRSTSAAVRPDYDSIVGVVGAEYASSTGAALNNSWPAEIISSKISHVQPQREGVLVEWRVRVGDRVSAGQILAKLSAPPATPELIAMLAEKTESLTRARAQAELAGEYAVKEQARFDSLSVALTAEGGGGAAFTALEQMRKKAETKKALVRSFIEQALSAHVVTVTGFSDWRNVRYGGLNSQYGALNQNVQNQYESALISLAATLKASADTPEAEVENYFSLAVRLANSSGANPEVAGFRAMAVADQKEFLDMVADYREALADVSDKEAEYKLMIREQGAMVERDRGMAEADVKAMEASYATVRNEILGGTNIVAPRSGTVSAIYKRAGDLVDPATAVAVISGRGAGELTVRIRIPNNVKKPSAGDTISVVRPGFSGDIKRARILGVGDSLDDLGSYMADAVLLDPTDWPAGTSVRVIVPSDSSVPSIKITSVWWAADGTPRVWRISEAGRIFSQEVKLGRTLGTYVEIYEGLRTNDRYIVNTALDISEDMLLDELVEPIAPAGSSGGEMPAGHENMPGMQM